MREHAVKKRKETTVYTDIRFLSSFFLKMRYCTTCISLQLKTITVQRANRRKPGLISFSVFQTHEIWLSFYGVHYQYSCVLILRSIPLRSVTVCIEYCRSLLGHLLGHSPADMFMLSYIEITGYTNNNNKTNLYQISVPATCMSLRKTQNHCATRNVSRPFSNIRIEILFCPCIAIQ